MEDYSVYTIKVWSKNKELEGDLLKKIRESKLYRRALIRITRMEERSEVL